MICSYLFQENILVVWDSRHKDDIPFDYPDWYESFSRGMIDIYVGF